MSVCILCMLYVVHYVCMCKFVCVYVSLYTSYRVETELVCSSILIYSTSLIRHYHCIELKQNTQKNLVLWNFQLE